MLRSTSIPANQGALWKKAVMWLVFMGLGAAILAAPAVAQECPTNSQIIQQIIDDSIAEYRAKTGGNCPCPYNTASDGSTCGARSAWSRSGGAEPLCYPTDVTDAMVLAWKQQNNVFAIGSGATFMQVCFSEEGTLRQFESPAGVEHLRAGGSGEGYALCSSAGVHGFVAGVAEDGFGPPTITQPGGPGTFPLTITRPTLDGIFQFTQTFSRDSSQLELLLSMTLKNLSSVAQASVKLARYFHGAIDNDTGDDRYFRTPDTVVGKESYGVMLTAQTFGTGHTIAVEKFQDWNPASGGGTARGCTAIGQSTPTAPGDFVGRVTYNLGTINPGSSKTVKALYRRF